MLFCKRQSFSSCPAWIRTMTEGSKDHRGATRHATARCNSSAFTRGKMHQSTPSGNPGRIETRTKTRTTLPCREVTGDVYVRRAHAQSGLRSAGDQRDVPEAPPARPLHPSGRIPSAPRMQDGRMSRPRETLQNSLLGMDLQGKFKRVAGPKDFGDLARFPTPGRRAFGFLERSTRRVC